MNAYMHVFGKQDFQYLYDNCFSEHDRGSNGLARFLHITDKGVFFDVRLLEGYEALKHLRWKPVHELAGPHKPSSSGPALPFPFTKNHLAAFMLWGWGGYLQDAFGRLDCGPNEFVMNGDHEDAADAYEALRQAYVIYQEALHVVGELDHEQQCHADELNIQYYDAHHRALVREKVMEHDIPRSEYRLRRRRARAPIALLKVQAEGANAKADAALKTWRRAMVRQLLQPQCLFSTTPQSSDPRSIATKPSSTLMVGGSATGGVEPYKVGPLPVEQGLLTKDIAEAFDSVNGWKTERWRRNLSGSKWLHPARIALGLAGGASALWDPVMLAQLMHDKAKGERKKEQLMRILHSRFIRNPVLGPWRDAFYEYFATHCTAN